MSERIKVNGVWLDHCKCGQWKTERAGLCASCTWSHRNNVRKTKEELNEGIRQSARSGQGN